MSFSQGLAGPDTACSKQWRTRAEALRVYYRVAGSADELNKTHNPLYVPDELEVEGGERPRLTSVALDRCGKMIGQAED